MTFANPFAWALLALLAVPVVLYLLPMPRRRSDQPSLMLWQKMLKERPASQSWRWLRTLVSFIFQAIILVLLVVAAGKPIFSPAAGEGRTAIVVLDASASMQAPVTPGSKVTRFDRAKALAQDIVGALPSGRGAAVVAVEETPRILAGLTDRRPAVLRTIETLTVTSKRGDVAAAIRTALELARAEAGADVYLLSDGGADVSGVALGGAKLHYLRLGRTLPNAGIVTCRAQRTFEDPLAFDALVRVENASDAERTLSLRVSMDDNVIETRALKIAPGQVASENLSGIVRGSGELRVSLDPGDALALDDSAVARLGATQKTQVVLVSDVPDRFLESALTANRGIDSYLATLSQYLEKRPQPDVLVFSGVLPPELPAGNLLIINPPNATSLFRTSEDLAQPKITDWRRAHPIMADITLKDVEIPSAKALEATADAETLIESSGGPLMLACDSPQRRVVALGFDPGRSSLSFRVAFPVMMANSFAWLTRAGSAPPADANLDDAAESNLAVPSELAFADAKVSGQEDRGGGLGEFWLLAAAAALALAGVEWYLYHHRVTV